MNCRICGTRKKVAYRPKQRQTLCAICAEGVPRKATRRGFDKAYWGSQSPGVPESTKREFYDDYKKSTHTVQEYIDVTSSWIFDD